MRRITAFIAAVAFTAATVMAAPPPDLLARAEKGDGDAQLALSRRYRDGREGERDHKSALTWARRAADGGHPDGLDEVGYHYLRGLGAPEDHDVAVGYFRAAARRGSTNGWTNLGHCAFSGLGVDQDYARAVDGWTKAARQGGAAAALHLAMVYAAGDGVARDPAAAARWCRPAADAGHPDALVLLGELRYEAGDPDAARAAWERAAGMGSRPAKDLLDLLAWRGQPAAPGRFAFVEYRHVHQGWNNCGAAACTMLAKFGGSPASQYDVKRLCPGPIGAGTDWADLVAAAGRLGQRWELITFPNDGPGFEAATARLRAELDRGRPAVIDLTHPGGAGHTVTVAGYHRAADVYVLRDPARPSPGLRVLPSADLARAWHSRHYSRTATGRCRPAIVLRDE